MIAVFADTSYFVASISPRDVAHRRAKSFDAAEFRVVTTAWIMAELASYLASPMNRSVFTSLLARLRSDPMVEFVPATQALFDRGAELYAERPDKASSLVDCISFVVMREHRLTDALTADRHFEQAGFRALMAEGEA